MEKNKITITTIPVTIKVMEVGGKKLTLSVFKQIPIGAFLQRKSEEEIKASFLGWIKYDGVKHILFHQNGILLKEHTGDYSGKVMEVFKPYLLNENQIYIAI
jgi:hypothetical protein